MLTIINLCAKNHSAAIIALPVLCWSKNYENMSIILQNYISLYWFTNFQELKAIPLVISYYCLLYSVLIHCSICAPDVAYTTVQQPSYVVALYYITYYVAVLTIGHQSWDTLCGAPNPPCLESPQGEPQD